MRVVVFVGVLIACIHASVWAVSRDIISAPAINGQLASVSYTPFDTHPDGARPSSPEQIRADLKAIAPYTRMVRTYSSTGGAELVPEVAREFGLRVSVGAWIDKNTERNGREMRNVIDLARKHRNIDSVVVGNETIYRGEQTVDELISKIHRVKRETSVPVTTGEIWSAWLDHPELASAVDFIAAHVLPYWEGIPETAAVDQAIRIYDMLRAAYPGKRIVIAEFGWPSAGYNRRDANPDPLVQARVLRSFVARAESLGIDYNIIEAYDQPWKTFEGGVGPYWGMFDTKRQPKFSWTGPITDPDHWKLAGIAVLIGVLLSLPILSLAGATASQTALLATTAHVVGAWFAILFAYWNGHYFVTGAAIAYGLALLLLIPLIFIAMKRIEEIANIAFGTKPRRLIVSPPLVPELPFVPKVSIHIPAYREPPEMIRQTLDAVAQLEYPNFECIIVINNTPDPALWRPIEEHCMTLGERFKFVREDNLDGFKAGALRLALTHTAADAEIIGVLDADYVVKPNWLKDLLPLFADPKVGMIQAPQDHRDGPRTAMHQAMNGEYAGFFDIGMVQRNEKNAIIAHGTMCLIRRSALVAAGNWSSDTICEDTDLGLTILELGFTAHYTNRRYGYGLLPDSYLAYKRQRDRWAYGGFQIMKKHWRRFLPGRSLLSREQKREFSARLAVVARRRERRRAGRAAQPHLGAVRRHRRHRHPRQDLDHSDPRRLRGGGRAFLLALPAAGSDPARPDAGRGVRRHGPAVDRRSRGRFRPDQGRPAVRTHRQGRLRTPQRRFPGVLGGGDRRLAGGQRRSSCMQPIGSSFARSTCLRWHSPFSRCRSWPRSRWPCWKAAASTTSRSGTASKAGLARC